MKFNVIKNSNKEIAELSDPDYIIKTAGDFLDLIANAPARTIAIPKENIVEEFFDLKTGLAGEIMQKAVNYQIRLIIIGDFSKYESKSLRDLIRESNRTGQIVFVDSIDSYLAK